MSSEPTRIVIAAGGTAGHVVPAIAVADALRADGARVTFVGAGRAEAELVPAAGYELHRIDVAGIDRSRPLLAMRALGKASAAVPRSRSLLARVDPAAVMGGGGYVAGPVGLAALTLRKPLVLTEADSRLGLTNRLLAPFARRVCLAFPIEGRDGRRYRVTGRPVSSARLDAGAARARMGVAAGERAVLVFGGSLGARSINLAAIEAFAEAPFHVIHVSGRRDHAELASRPRSSRYDLREYLPIEDFAAALAASDLVVARAGGSVFEIAAQARPAILIPYPRSAGGHQLDNARWMERAGAARVIDDRELTAGRLASAVSSLLADDRRLREMGEASAALARPQAARDIAAELLAAAR